MKRPAPTRCVSLDVEWHALTAELACVQTCDLRADGSTSDPVLRPAWPAACDEAATTLRRDLTDPTCAILGHNVAGDLLALANAWGLIKELELAYEAGRIRCSYLAQLLINVAWPGRPTWIWLPAEAEPEADDETDPDAPGHALALRGRRRGFWALRKYAPHVGLKGEIEITTDDADGGRGVQVKSGLGDLIWRYLGIDLSADKKGADSWRLRYGELIGVPIAEWPPEALRYALEDPVWAARLRVEQQRRPPHPYDGRWVEAFYPPAGSPPWAPFRCEQVEAWAHLALVDMAGPGMMIDSPRVVASRDRLHKVAEVAERVAIGTGVVRLEVHHDAAAAGAAGLSILAVTHDRAAAKEAGLDPAWTRGTFAAARELAAAGDAEGLELLREAHPWIRVERKNDAAAIRELFAEARRLAAERAADSLEALRAAHPWLTVDRIKCDDEVRERAEAAYKAAGWRELPKTDSGAVSAGADNLTRVVVPADRAAAIADAVARGIDPAAAAEAFDAAAEDLRALMGPELLARLQAWTDSGELPRIEAALRAASDPGLAAHLARQKARTFDTSFLAPIDAATRAERRASEEARYVEAAGRRLTDDELEHLARKWAPEGPARYGVSPFKSTSRTGLRGDVRQNMPQDGGVRECYVPRAGKVFVATDYAACELSCQADNLDRQVVRGVLKEDRYSTLGQAIRAGDDCHMRVVATLRGEPYDEINPERKRIGKLGPDALPWERKWHKEIELQRRGGKEANFGFWGGMGPRKFAFLQARKGNPMSEGFARDLRAGWIFTWNPESEIYFRLANDATTLGGRLIGATVVHDRNGHVRGAVDYCQWANTHFQYLAARGAKLAAIMLRRACKLDPTSPLYGIAEPVIFIHDEFVCEVDEAAVDAHEQLERYVDGLEASCKGRVPTAELVAARALLARSAVNEIGRVMRAGMGKVVDTPVKTEAKICRLHWSK